MIRIYEIEHLMLISTRYLRFEKNRVESWLSESLQEPKQKNIGLAEIPKEI